VKGEKLEKLENENAGTERIDGAGMGGVRLKLTLFRLLIFPPLSHSAFTPETYSMIVAHLAATRHAWKGLKVCDELNSMDSSHTPMSYL